MTRLPGWAALALCAAGCGGGGFVPRADGGFDAAVPADQGAGDLASDAAAGAVTFTQVPTGSASILFSVWGSGADLFAAGTQQTILHSGDGKTWQTQMTGAAQLDAVWGSSPTDVYAVGWGAPLLLHSTDRGASWQTEASGTSGPPLLGIWGGGPNDVLACDGIGEVLRFDGATWSHQSVGTAALIAVWGTGKTRVVVGNQGQIFVSTDGGASFSARDSGTTISLSSVWGVGTDLFVTGSDEQANLGAILRSSDGGTTWSQSPTPTAMWGIWASAASDVWAVGDAGAILHSTDGGASFQPVNSGATVALRAVWGSSARDVWVVGGDGMILHGT